MTNLMIRSVTLATCSIALIAAFSVTPVVAAGGSDLGGGEANYGGMNQRSAYPPSSYPKRSRRVRETTGHWFRPCSNNVPT